jgi:thymidylate synthase ThyX
MPPEKSAYALARYSRSPDSIRDSIEWVRTHDSQKFLESFYFQYGHASIADLGHSVLCFEGISELAATEIEEEPLWDGQAKSSRYQDFSRSGFITPPELPADGAAAYQAAGDALLTAYGKVNELAFAALCERLPRPEDLKPEAYRRNVAARAFDVARYLLFWGVPTNVGQVTSIRTLEKQIRRLKGSEYAELRELGEEVAQSCAAEPDCRWDLNAPAEALAPTLARHADPDEHTARARADLKLWAEQNLPAAAPSTAEPERVDLVRPTRVPADIAATLLYPVTDRPFRELYDLTCGWSERQRAEVVDVALGSRTRRDEILAGFRGGLYAYDMVIDIGAYRDMHRHRRCQKFRQPYSGNLGYDTPDLIGESGAAQPYHAAMQAALDTMHRLPAPAAHYLLPFGARSRFLFKMDFAEAEYISRLRSGVKGHFSYRQIAWEMKCKMEQVEPELGRLIDATPPWVEDPLKR